MSVLMVSTLAVVLVGVGCNPVSRNLDSVHGERMLNIPEEQGRPGMRNDPLENLGIELVDGFLVEGDIKESISHWPRVEVAAAVAGGFGPETPPVTRSPMQRNSVSLTGDLWEDRVIPYVLDTSFSVTELAEIKSALSEVMEGSGNCVHFVQRQQQVDFLYITGDLDGCYSEVGRKGHNQTVSISRKTDCIKKGIIMHELLHALGLYHEHTRKDRDSFITVLNDNILDGHGKDFYINTAANISATSYDYYSIMHYKTTSFSKDPSRLNTIQVLNSSVSLGDVGQRKYLTSKDKTKIRSLYNCPVTQCSYPLTQYNDHVSVKSTNVGSIIRYSCNDSRHVLIGAAERTCLYNGFWSGSTPVCLNNQSVISYCGFEHRSICGWSQDTTDDINWTRYSSQTPSENTGPFEDHTLQTPDGFYMYLEGTYIGMDKKARLISPEFYPDQSTSVCMLFWYNMYGEGMGRLSVSIKSQELSKELWNISGNQQVGWKMALITNLNISGPYRILIEGVRGSADATDMAIDDVIIGNCQEVTSYKQAVIRERSTG